jgi:hypothetical protein
MEGTLILKHICKKWKKGIKKPKIVSDKKDGGYMKCSLCGEKVGGNINFR